MASREQVEELLSRGLTYEEVGAELGLAPGLVFMIATGLPADSSAATSPDELDRRGAPQGSTQHLVGPPSHNPTRSESVLRWVRERAARELTRTG
jgi:hypothetical protein